MSKDFRITPADHAVCVGCKHDFQQHDDCRKCAFDAASRHYQYQWWRGAPHLMFMGVNIGEALAQDARHYVGAALRTKEDLDASREEA